MKLSGCYSRVSTLHSLGFCMMMLLAQLNASTAQVLQPKRFEIPQKGSEDYWTVISLKEDGLALFRDKDKYKQNNKIWELKLLDSTLHEKKSLDVIVKERYKMIGYEVTPGRIFFLYRTGETNKNDFELIEITTEGEEVTRHNIKPDLDFRITHFIKAGENIILGGYVSNEAVVLVFETGNKSIKVVPGFFQKDTELVDLRANQNQTFNTLLLDRSSRGERKITFRTFDETGKQLLEDVIPVEDNISLQTGLVSSLEREDLLVGGTWGDRNAKQALGFYAVGINPFEDQKIQFIDFGRLSHYVDYMKPKRAQRIKTNAKENAEANRKPSYSSYLMPYRLIENNNGFYMLGEVYVPSNNFSNNYTNPSYYPYSNPYYWTGAPYFYPMGRMYRPYMFGPPPKNNDDVKTIQSVIVAFDANGKVKWDHSFKFEDLRQMTIDQISDAVIMNNKLFLIYKKESELKVKSIVLVEDDITEISEKVKTPQEHDVIRSEKEYETGVRHWYGNSFYVWGYQTIRNTTKEERVRDVFYINRVDVY